MAASDLDEVNRPMGTRSIESIVKERCQKLNQAIKTEECETHDERQSPKDVTFRYDRPDYHKDTKTFLGYTEVTMQIKRVRCPDSRRLDLHQMCFQRTPDKVYILFVGTNPSTKSPTWIPFYEKTAITDLIGAENLSQNFAQNEIDRICPSGDRFHKFMRRKFGSSVNFFQRCCVINYCPLVFEAENGQSEDLEGFNNTDNSFVKKLMSRCDNALKAIINSSNPSLVVGIGRYAFNRLTYIDDDRKLQIRHPSPEDDPLFENPWEVDVEHKLKNHVIWNDLMDQMTDPTTGVRK